MRKIWTLLGGAILAGALMAVVGNAASSLPGPELVDRLGCLGCHSLKGKGGRKGPAWDGVGARLSPDALRKQIISPRGRMPSFAHIKPEELETLVEYLSGLK